MTYRNYLLLVAMVSLALLFLQISPSRTSSQSAETVKTITVANAEQVTQFYRIGQGTVNVVDWAPNGQRLSVGTSMGIWIYDTSAFDVPPILYVDGYDVWDLQFSPNSQQVAFASESTVYLVDISSGAIRSMTGHTGRVDAIDFSPSGDRLASISLDQTIRIWDVNSSSEILRLTSPERTFLSDVAFGSESNLASGDQGGLRIWDLDSGELMYSISEYGSPRSSRSIIFIHSYQVLWSNGNQLLLTYPFGPPNRTYVYDQDDSSDFIALSGDSTDEVLASGSNDGLITLRNTSFEQYDALRGHSGRIRGIDFSPDGMFLVSASEDGTVRIWNAHTGNQEHLLEGYDRFASAAVGPSGSPIVIGGIERIWIGNNPQEINKHQIEENIGGLLSPEFTSDDRRVLFIAGATGSVYVWNVLSQVQETVFPGSSGVGSLAIAVSEDGDMLAMPTSGNVIRVYNMDYHNELGSLSGHSSEIYEMNFVANDSRLVSANVRSPSSTQIWDLANYTEIANLPVDLRAISPDRLSIATESENVIELYDVSGQRTASIQIEGDRYTSSVIFSPDSRQIAIGTSMNGGAFFGNILLWDAHNNIVREIGGTSGISGITSLAFSPEGSILASSGYDGVIRLWNAQSGDLLTTLKPSSGPYAHLTFTQNGQYLISFSDHQSTVRFWGISSASDIAALEPDFSDSPVSEPSGQLWNDVTQAVAIALDGVLARRELPEDDQNIILLIQATSDITSIASQGLDQLGIICAPFTAIPYLQSVLGTEFQSNQLYMAGDYFCTYGQGFVATLTAISTAGSVPFALVPILLQPDRYIDPWLDPINSGAWIAPLECALFSGTELCP